MRKKRSTGTAPRATNGAGGPKSPSPEAVGKATPPESNRRSAVRADAALSSVGLSQTLRDAFPDQDIERRLRLLCDATQMTPDGPIPDWKVRTKSLQLLLAYREGTPIARQEQPIRPKVTNEMMHSRFRDKPGLRRSMIAYLQSLDEEQSGAESQNRGE